MRFQQWNNLTGWLTFAITATVLGAAAEPTGSLWDCGEFISGAYKLQVVHPPGAPVFLLIGRLFTWVAEFFSGASPTAPPGTGNPAMIAYAVNLLSAISTAFAATFICWSTTILARLIVANREQHEYNLGQTVAILGAGLVAGLTTAFTSSVWFSAVEGEVYAMSTFFTAMTLWATLKWYDLPDTPQADRWLVFAFFSTGLSIGVHLLSLLTYPALAIFYYSKKVQKPTFGGMLLAALVGVAFIIGIQVLIVTGIPKLWASFDLFMVNNMGLPFYSGIIPVILLFGGVIAFLLIWAHRAQNGLLQRITVAFGVTLIAYMAYGMVVIRANANTPINMNDPSDALRLLPYLNREQYGERPLLRGPHFDSRPAGLSTKPRYGRLGDRYEIVDEKIDYKFSPNEETLFPRMSDNSQGRPRLYRQWIDKKSGTPTLGDNIEYFWKYQIGWMYWRYFMWNFAGRQNGDQGLFAWDPSSGHWLSGLGFVDEPRLGNQDELPDYQKNNAARNTYFLIPFLLGLVGFFFHMRRRPQDFMAILALFVITGIGIIVYSNQPPSEPRERDYVLAGSFFTFAIWIGLSVLALADAFANSLRLNWTTAGAAGVLLSLSAPLLMVTQNWDDHSRAGHYGSRDYAQNFLQSCAPNAIIFTYGDNDTYPLWYCQEVEGIRTDVRVVNLSLIAVDWYIAQLRRKVNDSPAIDMSIPQEKIRGYKRVQLPYYAPGGEREMALQDVIKFLGEDHPVPASGGRNFDSYLPTRKFYIPVNKEEAVKNGILTPEDAASAVDTMHVDLGEDVDYLIKDKLAMLDIVASNIGKRPIYWAVTCREESLLGMSDFMQLEGLALRLMPINSSRENSIASFGLPGAGRVAADIAYKNILEKWRWGNFDTHPTYVDRAYMPSLQTMRLVFVRVGRQLVLEGKKDQAIALTDKYFQAFPAYNFPYDIFAAYICDHYAKAGATDKAAAKAREIADFTEQQLRYINSLSPAFQKAYESDFQYAANTAQFLIRMAGEMKDEALRKELQDKFGSYLSPMQLPGQN